MEAGNFTLAELGICEPTSHQNTYCPNLGLLHGYTLSAGSDADSDPEGPISPERAMQLWSTRNVKSRHSSGQSSHENSALTLTDSENENKSDDESGLQSFSRLLSWSGVTVHAGVDTFNEEGRTIEAE
ncbi:hypothetical protein QTP86_006224 [Hemibagrus guttatus]|nr:hypothetical protein QTP86_006224 [Hemibagrus guttatus]